VLHLYQPLISVSYGPWNGVLLGFNFVLGADTTGTNMELLRLSLHHDCGRVDVGFEAAVGMSFGMADIFTEHRCFTTNITLQSVYSLELLASILQTSVQ
jgi:hypothetical protein